MTGAGTKGNTGLTLLIGSLIKTKLVVVTKEGIGSSEIECVILPGQIPEQYPLYATPNSRIQFFKPFMQGSERVSFRYEDSEHGKGELVFIKKNDVTESQMYNNSPETEFGIGSILHPGKVKYIRRIVYKRK